MISKKLKTCKKGDIINDSNYVIKINGSFVSYTSAKTTSRINDSDNNEGIDKYDKDIENALFVKRNTDMYPKSQPIKRIFRYDSFDINKRNRSNSISNYKIKVSDI